MTAVAVSTITNCIVGTDDTVQAMQREIDNTGLWVGDIAAGRIRVRDDSWAVINTSKHFHATLVGVPPNQLNNSSHYLTFRREGLLSFNMVDAEARYYKMLGPQAFVDALDFIDQWSGVRSILINCDRGTSRSPTVALLYVAKRLHLIPEGSFADAHSAFLALYPIYRPGGIGNFVAAHWATIN
jgi:predicted protein tyrosine phosphatase